MIIDFLAELRDFSGEPLKTSKDGPNLTLKDTIVLSIKTSLPEDNAMSFTDKLALDKIGEIVYSGIGELDTAQATIIKERIAKIFTGPALAGAVNRAIEGK